MNKYKYRDPNKAPLFRGGERMRLMATLSFLAVLGMFFYRSRDSQSWHWFAGDDDPLSPRVLEARDRELGRVAPRPTAERPVNPPRYFYVPDPPPVVSPPPVAAAAESVDNLLAMADEPPPPVLSEAPAAATQEATAPQQPAAPQEATVSQQPTAPTIAAQSGTTDSSAANNSAADTSATSSAAVAATDDIPPPEARLDPTLADKPKPPPTADAGQQPNMDAVQTPAPPVAGAPKAAYNAANPNTARLADDVAPPEVTTDAEQSEFPSSVKGRAVANAAPTKIEVPPIDEDSIERGEFNYDAQAITDKKELRVEEMAAYWRLVDWSMKQTFQQMEKRARNDLMYAHFYKDPEKYRGRLVRLNLRIDRATATDAEGHGKARGLTRTYEAVGYTEESSPNHYSIMLTDLPADFPLRNDMQEDVTFVGYFFKLLEIQSRDDKHRAVPMLIGKVFWHENPPVGLPFPVSWLFGGVAGIVAIVMLIVRMTFKLQPLRPRSTLPPLHDGEEGVPIESWLERIEEAGQTPPPSNTLHVNGHADGDRPMNGAQHHPEQFTEDPEPGGG